MNKQNIKAFKGFEMAKSWLAKRFFFDAIVFLSYSNWVREIKTTWTI